MIFDTWKKGKRSYAQCGEDLIVDFILENRFRLYKPTYLDIGAHDPVYLSNTYFFYKKGAKGVSVEPDPFLWKKIKSKRTRDTCLNVGVGVGSASASDFYVMDCKTLNTFSREDAERYRSQDGHKIESVISLPMMSIDEILNNYFEKTPNFVSLDVEGLDVEILKAFDFGKFRPEVFCVETLTYTKDFSGKKIDETMSVMAANEYFVYADTFINTIFVDKRAWERRQ